MEPFVGLADIKASTTATARGNRTRLRWGGILLVTHGESTKGLRQLVVIDRLLIAHGMPACFLKAAICSALSNV